MVQTTSVSNMKQQVELSNIDFTEIDIFAPDFDLSTYTVRVHELIRDAGVATGSVAITWENLTCTVPVSPTQLSIPTVGSGVHAGLSFIKQKILSFRCSPQSSSAQEDENSSNNNPLQSESSTCTSFDEGVDKDCGTVLNNATGYLKPGQLCLVLGQSGSGKSLLMSKIAGRALPKLIKSSNRGKKGKKSSVRDNYSSIGAVLYHHPDNMFSQETEERTVMSAVCPTQIINYVGEEDVHIPELTVRQTLEFAAECKWPASIPHVDVLRRNDVILTARALGIEHALDTIVGSTVLRGVSGGERKRLTIGEMCMGMGAALGGGSAAKVMVMDNWSKGLDSATTLSITKELREYADRVNGAAIVSMQAPAPEVFDLFDTLCILHEGHVIYFGPATKAELYFNNLGFTRPSHRTTPDFLATLFNPNFRSEYIRHVCRHKDTNIDDSIENLKKNHVLCRPESAKEFSMSFQRSAMASEMHTQIEIVKQHLPTAIPHLHILKLKKARSIPAGSSNGRGVMTELEAQPEVLLPGMQNAVLQKPQFQLKALLRRQANCLTSKRNALAQEFAQVIVFGLLMGSIFWQLPSSLGGADSRSALIFFGLLFFVSNGLSKMTDWIDAKQVFMKQRDAGFYSPWTWLLTESLTFDICVELIKSICLLVPLSLMAGLNVGNYGQRLAYSILISTMLSSIMMTVMRTFVAFFEHAEMSQGFYNILVCFFALYAGYMKSGDELDWYLAWIYWANPGSYALKAALLNEFVGLKFSCADDELVPKGVDLIDSAHPEIKFCPSMGSFDTGVNYLKTFRGITNHHNYRIYYVLVLAAFYVVCFFAGVTALTGSRRQGHARTAEKKQHDQNSVEINISSSPHIASDNNHTQNESIDENNNYCYVVDKSNTLLKKRKLPKTAFTFTNITYTVESGKKVLLPGVTAHAVSGKVTLLLGTSGAGKTTLLDVCAFRKTCGPRTKTSGEVRVNGKLVKATELARRSGYCEQNDVHVGGATVYEAVLFSIKLRLRKKDDVSLAEKKKRVVEVLEMLGLTTFANMQVNALGSGELKLLTMALEVVTDPEVLFLDEPTSGLSINSALKVAQALRSIADARDTAVICTLHQPSKEVFQMFDQVLVLRKGGQAMYFGDIGTEALTLRKYFEKHGATRMLPHENPAAWMLDVVADEAIDWHKQWLQSDERKMRMAETLAFAQLSTKKETQQGCSFHVDLSDSHSHSFNASSSFSISAGAVNLGNAIVHNHELNRNLDTQQEAENPPSGAPSSTEITANRVSLSTQIKEVVHRQFQLYWRMPEYNGTRLALSAAIALLLGVLFLGEIRTDQQGFSSAFAALFLTLMPVFLFSLNVIPTTMTGRDVFYREVSSGTFQPIAHHIAVCLVEVPYTLASSLIFAVVFYFMIGLDPARFGYFALAVAVVFLMAVMFGVMLSAISPAPQTASVAGNAICSLFMVLSGFLIRKPQMPSWWRWTTWVNPFHYYLSGTIVNQFNGKVFTCDDRERMTLSRPNDVLNCTDLVPWMRNEADGICSFCPTPSGQTLIDMYGANDVDKWVCLATIVAGIFSFVVIAAYGFTRMRFLSR